MATIAGPLMHIQTIDGAADAILFYDDVNGKPVRVDTFSSTGRAYKVELEGPGPQTLNFLIPLGSGSRDVPNPVAQGIDVRPDVEGVFENLSLWVFRLDV